MIVGEGEVLGDFLFICVGFIGVVVFVNGLGFGGLSGILRGG